MKYLIDDKDLKEIALIIDNHAAKRTVAELFEDNTMGDTFVDYLKEYAGKNSLCMDKVFSSMLKKAFIEKLDTLLSEYIDK
jgi:hypothetical protein